MATRCDARSFATDRPPPAHRGRLSRRDWQEIRRAVSRFNVDEVYSVEMYGVKVVLRRHADIQRRAQVSEAEPGNDAEPQLSDRQRRRRERSALRASRHRERQQEQQPRPLLLQFSDGGTTAPRDDCPSPDALSLGHPAGAAELQVGAADIPVGADEFSIGTPPDRDQPKGRKRGGRSQRRRPSVQ